MEISTRTTETLMRAMQVHLDGVERRDANGNPIASVSTPTRSEATAALTRAARVQGADAVINTGSDYRRLTLASGPLSTTTAVVVQAWGMAVRRD